MTESEAKVILESEYKFHGECSVFGEALTIAIKSLEENEQYKVLGTVEELRIAKGKQIPKKPIFNGTNWYRCVNGCEIHKKQFEKDWYCPKCGQKLDWSDEE